MRCVSGLLDFCFFWVFLVDSVSLCFFLRFPWSTLAFVWFRFMRLWVFLWASGCFFSFRCPFGILWIFSLRFKVLRRKTHFTSKGCYLLGWMICSHNTVPVAVHAEVMTASSALKSLGEEVFSSKKLSNSELPKPILQYVQKGKAKQLNLGNFKRLAGFSSKKWQTFCMFF